MITLAHGWALALCILAVWLAVWGWRRHRAARRAKASWRYANMRRWGMTEEERFTVMRALGYSVAEIAQAEEDAK